MKIYRDFTGYKLLVPFIQEAKVGRYKISEIEVKIRSNKVLQKMFDYMNSDMRISVEEYLLIIADAFSGAGFRSGLDKSHLSFVKKIYEYCSSHWNLIEEMVSFLSQIDIEKKMCSMVEKYLPRNIEPPNMVLHFVFDGGDCRGFQREIYADLTLLSILGKTKALRLLAHEFHHSCRAEIAVPYEKESYPEIFQTLDWLESEGIADKIFDLGDEKPENEFEPLLKLAKRRRCMYSNAKSYLKLFDNAVQRSENPMPIFSNNAYHPVGHFMADVIESIQGTQKLVKTVGDPFDFVEAYNKSARTLQKSAVFILSEETITRLRKIRAEIRKKT